ncbi:O-antigen ligase family protein [Falsiroseomonas sp. HW251]|uniref:O-antigen ligase family protein n=1 Tax=Falsiroseomonas sp. HW251 TaxID=3390998 RepID=UPI003D323148
MTAAALPAEGVARSPSLPVAVLLAVTPALAVAQFRAMALAVTVGFALAIAAHWRNHRSLPWPRLTALSGLAAALVAWLALSSLWSPDLLQGLGTAGGLAALLVLAAMTARALEQDGAANRRLIGLAVAPGLLLGIALLALDYATGNWFRLAVRGFPEWTPRVFFGLKPAVSVLVLLLPLVLAVPGLNRAARGAILAAGVAVALWLPAESAKIAALAGVAAGIGAAFAPRLLPRLTAAVLALLVLAMPLLLAASFTRPPDLSALPFSAAHRVLIWDFVIGRVAEKPVLGWGADAARAIPGAEDGFSTEVLDRFGLTSPEERDVFGRHASRLPLHPHNAALHVWLETGLVGAVIAAALAAAAMLAAAASPIAGATLGVGVSGAITGLLSYGAWQPWWIATVMLAAVALGALQRGHLDAPAQRRL